MDHSASALEQALKASEDEREKLNRILREVEGKLNLVLRNVTDIIYTLDDNGLITFINDGIRGFGFTPHELVGLDIFEIVHPEDRDRAFYHVKERRCGERGTRSFELRLATRAVCPEKPSPGKMDRQRLFSLNAEGQWAIKDKGNSEFVGTIGIVKPLQQYGARDVSEITGTVEEAEKGDTKLIPICSHCKKIRMNNGNWKSIEAFLQENGQLTMTHTICDDCVVDHFPGV